MTIWIRSPSRTLPIGPPASASGPTWPMHAPVETPENRASVSTATCLPKLRCFRARRDLVDLLHAGAHRPAADQHQHVAGLRPASGPWPLIAAIAARSRGEDPRRADLAVDAVGIDHARVDGRALDDRAFRGQVAAREGHRRVRPRCRGPRPGDMITSSGSTPSRSCEQVAQPRAALGLSPTSPAPRRAARRSTVRHVEVEQARARAGAASPRARRRPGRRAPSDGRPGRSAARRPAAAPGG